MWRHRWLRRRLRGARVGWGGGGKGGDGKGGGGRGRVVVFRHRPCRRRFLLGGGRFCRRHNSFEAGERKYHLVHLARLLDRVTGRAIGYHEAAPPPLKPPRRLTPRRRLAPPLPGMIPALGEIATSRVTGRADWVLRGSSVESTEQRLTSMREGLGEWEEGGLSADIRASLRRMTQAHIRSAMAEIGVQVGDSRPDEGGGGGGGAIVSDAEDDDETRPFNTMMIMRRSTLTRASSLRSLTRRRARRTMMFIAICSSPARIGDGPRGCQGCI